MERHSIKQAWAASIQGIIDWLEEHMGENPTLSDMAGQIGYSPCYCSTLFRRATGMSLKRYMAGRRLALCTIALRDTKERILDIALRYGYQSQEAFSRAFMEAYGLTPSAYRRNPRPVKMPIKPNLQFPWTFERRDPIMDQDFCLTAAQVRVEYIPDHRFLGVWEPKVDNYCDFWEQDNACDDICGIIDSMAHVAHPVVGCHTAGWYDRGDGQRGYVYGLGLSLDYQGELPMGFESRDIPGGYYLVFYHPKFDFMRDCEAVMNRVEELAWGFDPGSRGFMWKDPLRAYQRHDPDGVGYEVLRPVLRG